MTAKDVLYRPPASPQGTREQRGDDLSDAGKAPFLTRVAIQQLLSDGEVANVSSAEAKTHLRLGDEYLDLDHLQQGVQRADGTRASVENPLPRKAVHEDTWRRILRQLKAARL